MIAGIPSFRLRVSLAETKEEIQECRQLIYDTYLREYDIEMTLQDSQPDGGVERMPDRLIMGQSEGRVVACAGLYIRDTYIERFGEVQPHEVDQRAVDAGIIEPEPRVHVEYTKVVVHQDLMGRGLGRLFIGASHTREFLQIDGRPPILLVCGKLSILGLWRAAGIRTRRIREFPIYRNHDRYRTPGDPMESHMIIPEIDIHPRWYDRDLPYTLVPGILGGILAR